MTRYLNKRLIVECLRELNDRESQSRLWLSKGHGEVSSFTEAVEQLFTDSGLTPDLEKRTTGLGPNAEGALLRLQAAAAKVPAGLEPFALIESTEMESVRRLAAVALGLLEST